MNTISGFSSSSPDSSALTNASKGLANGNQALVQAAVQTATPGNTNFINPAVQESQSLQLVQASAEAASTASQMLGSLLNVTA
jgi:hypothetical protein